MKHGIVTCYISVLLAHMEGYDYGMQRKIKTISRRQLEKAKKQLEAKR